MFNKHKAVVGNTTALDTDIRDFMIRRAITSYQVQAGMIPQIMLESDNLPQFKARNRRVKAVRYIRQWDIRPVFWKHVQFGWIDELTIECVEPLCHDCAYSIRLYLKFNAYVHSNDDAQKCCLCKQMCNEYIPF